MQKKKTNSRDAPIYENFPVSPAKMKIKLRSRITSNGK
jgi:hypothetical protein